jgi:hypothetical protein
VPGTQINEGRSSALAPKFKIEQSTIKGQSLVDISDFERDVAQTKDTSISCSIHGGFLWISL